MIAAALELERCLSKLPGFGRKSSMRAALALLREPDKLLKPLVAALEAAERDVKLCSTCGAFTVNSEDPCRNCTDAQRAIGVLCVVEEPQDIVQIESTGAFKGRYHSLGGKLSPMHRVGPENIRIKELLLRIPSEGIKEVVLALSTDMDGDATASYIAQSLRSADVKVTRLAFGLPADSGVAYSDPLTLKRALQGRLGVF